jgi:hypothetical protein
MSRKTAFSKRPPRIVEIEWIDSAVTAGWMHDTDSKRVVALSCRSVGYVAHRSRQALTLVQSLDEQDPARKCQAMTIPLVAIKWVRRLTR